MTPADLLQRQLRRDSTRPLLTWYDDATGERVELSVATAANWAAKTANLLADEHGLEPGDVIALEPAAHWLSVVALLGAWTAGVAVDVTGAAGDVVLPGEPKSFMAAVLPQPDALLVPAPKADGTALVADGRSWTATELVDVTGTPPDQCRVLTTLPLDSIAGLRAGLLAPLAANGSAVLVVHADMSKLAERARTERVTHTAGVDLPGLPRLP